MGQNLLFFIKRRSKYTPIVRDYFDRLGDLRLGGSYDAAISRFINAVNIELGWPENGAYQLLGGYSYPGNTTGAVPGIFSSHNTGTLVTFPSGAWDPKRGPLSDGSTMFTRLGRNNNADPQNDQAMGAIVTQTTPGTFGAIIGAGVSENGATTIVQTPTETVFTRNRSATTSGGLGPVAGVTGFCGMARSIASAYKVYANNVVYDVTTTSQTPLNEEVKGYRRGDVAPAYFTGRLLFQFTGPAIGFLDSDARLHTFRAICAKLASDLDAA